MARRDHIEIDEGRRLNALGIERPKELHRALVGNDVVVRLHVLHSNDRYVAARPVLALGRPPQRADIPLVPAGSMYTLIASSTSSIASSFTSYVISLYAGILSSCYFIAKDAENAKIKATPSFFVISAVFLV